MLCMVCAAWAWAMSASPARMKVMPQQLLGATEDFVVDAEALQDVEHRERNLRGAQDVTAKVKDDVCLPLALVHSPW